MGQVIRAWRTHPHHGRHPVPQTQVAAWVGMSQAQLSRVENGPPIVHLDRLAQWATVLRIPPDRLWFALPARNDRIDQMEGGVDRRQFFASAAIATGGILRGQPTPESRESDEAVLWLAWHLWQSRTDELDLSRVPQPFVRRLNTHPHVVRGAGGGYRFTDPHLTEVLVAHRVFGDITHGSGHLLATAQTSHATDLVISRLVAGEEDTRRGLVLLMRRGATAVLRVNAAGILAKVGAAELDDGAISVIRADQDARHLYVTAVASRVLKVPWEQAAHLSAMSESQRNGWESGVSGDTRSRASRLLTDELMNSRDAAARWCAALLVSGCIDTEDAGTRSVIMSAVRRERCPENLRAFAAALAGVTPLAMG
ncbi:helix-turn-helix transcriptional regulator [Micromonospora sp. WMMD980]|nr:helix-turn-helix transcriptional regulator [Micromonospora sp. WMMD980]MDG4805114.1 helix-turn-helix transcriptional regulator [Micromonospora sp. WMMD980]